MIYKNNYFFNYINIINKGKTIKKIKYQLKYKNL